MKAREEEEAELLEAQRKEEEAREQRRVDSKLIAGETIRRELAESEFNMKDLTDLLRGST